MNFSKFQKHKENEKDKVAGTPSYSAKPRKKRKKISANYLFNSGVYYLERFPASIAHFRFVMIRKIDRSFEDHPDQDRDQAIKWLDEDVIKKFIDLGYLNDRLFAKGVITSLRRKGSSRTKILMTMKQKKVEQDLVCEILEEVDQEFLDDKFLHDDLVDETFTLELNAALILCRRKKMSAKDYNDPSLAPEDQYKLKNKYMGRFARQGFSYDIANKALEMYGSDSYEG